MAAVLRVKRRNDEEPSEALVIACKRQKTAENLETTDTVTASVTAVLKFAGTLQNHGDDVVEHLTKNLSKEELKANFKQHVVNTTSKAREQTKQESQESRYKVVNCFRSLEPNDLEELLDKEITVIDVEDSPSYSKNKSEEDKYVYDLYYTQTGDDMLMDNLVSVHPFQEELVFDSYRDKNGVDSEIEVESEDSNSESNWRNDYPDSDHSENSICDEDMQAAVQRVNIGDEGSDLSTEDDDDLAYALAEDDVDHFGYKYAKYKAKIKAEMNVNYDEEVRSSAEENSDSGGDNSSGDGDDGDDEDDRQCEDP